MRGPMGILGPGAVDGSDSEMVQEVESAGVGGCLGNCETGYGKLGGPVR